MIVAPSIRYGRQKEVILRYVPKHDEKKNNLVYKGLMQRFAKHKVIWVDLDAFIA